VAVADARCLAREGLEVGQKRLVGEQRPAGPNDRGLVL
jgi:hypothetical protein